jgi:hypothetical protein
MDKRPEFEPDYVKEGININIIPMLIIIILFLLYAA